jgi:hypothetical protein
LLGMEPMFLVELYPFRCTKSPPLASRNSLLYGRDIESIDDPASGINRVIWIVDGSDHTICSPEISPTTCLTSCFVRSIDASLTEHILSSFTKVGCIHLSGTRTLELQNGLGRREWMSMLCVAAPNLTRAARRYF